MSRCFPFPPPGYEKKLTTDDPDLLKKEKRREKKHKKDKKDKEKKDGKEKKEKSRSEGKHKEKKDKHRDKKKDKEKIETSTPDEKNVYGQFTGYSGETCHHNNEQNIDDKKPSILFPHQNADLLRNKIKAGDSENFKCVQKLDRRIRDEEKGTCSQQFVDQGRKNYVYRVEVQKTDGRQVVMDVAGFGGNAAVPNRINGATPPPLDNIKFEKLQEKGRDDKHGDKRKYKDRDKEMDKEKKMEKFKEKFDMKKAERALNKHIMNSDLVAAANNLSACPLENSFLGVGNEGNLRKRKDIEKNGVSHENEPRPKKMARPIYNISPENGRKLDCFQSPGPSLLDKQEAFHGASQNSLKVGSKSGPSVNGMVSSQPVLTSARNPPTPASPPVITNHITARSPPVPTTKTQPNNIGIQLSTPKPPPSIPNPIASHQQPPFLSSPQLPTIGKQPHISRPNPPPAVVNKVAPPPSSIPKKKPPHPDTKYLNQILSVPKLDQWCGLDDREWLFSRKVRPSSKKPPIDELEVQVWSEAKHIESVDVCALPYVIPY